MTNATRVRPSLAGPRRLVWSIAFAAVLGFVLLLVLGPPNTWVSVVILGIVEGITEFLPISSTGHLLITADLLNFQESIGGTFEIFIQLGAILAVVAFYARDLFGQVRTVRTDPDVRRLWLGILAAFMPAAVIGLLLRDWIKAVLFESPSLIAWSLIVGGVVLIAVEKGLKRPPTTQSLQQITLRQAIAIGFVQVLALFPGVSRSGASMVGGMLGGLDRKTATAFSFYLAIPTLGGATIVDLLGSLDLITPADVARLAVGTLVSMAVAWWCIAWLLRYVSNHSFVAFGVYRILAGMTILGLVMAGIL
jgi:undecaprenyl-diphosphatase